MHRRRQALRFFSCLIAGGYSNSNAQAPLDSWYSPANKSAESFNTVLAWHKDFEEAETSQIKAVEEALATLPVVEVGGPFASRLAAREMKPTAGNRLFLVRSVRFAAHGAYTVISDSQSIRIHHHSLGFEAPIVRQGIIVVLAVEPKEVFCSCSMAR